MDLVSIISQVGFPIFAFLVAVYGLKYAYDSSLKQNEKAFDTVAELTSAVNNNTLVLTELVDRLSKENKEGE